MDPSSEPHRLRYAIGLDGVRALAVAAVVAYHLGTTSGVVVLPGGFLGVDLFFVLSGYLITSLLIVEAQQYGRISIKKFYVRRARRLLPALFTLLLAVGAVGAVWLPEQAARLRGDLVAAVSYATNWWLVSQNGSYFGGGGDRPELLTHLWSLAVEEQYYLVWPLVLMVFFLIRLPRVLMLLVILAGVAASTTAAALFYDPFTDPSRVYYGTDTRALAPLLGAALAVAVQPWRHRARLPRGTRHALDVLGITALLVLAAVAALLSDTSPLLYGAGFLGIATLGAVVVGVAGHPGTALGEMLALQPLKWLGERSYGIYLWHWPICVLTRPAVDVPLTGWADAGLRVALTLLLAEISYRLIEVPIRRHGFIAPFKRTVRALGGPLPVDRTGRPGVARGVARVAPAGTAVGHRGPSRMPLVRTVLFVVVFIAGATAVGVRLSAAARLPVAGGPVDLGPAQSLGPLTSMEAPAVTPVLPGNTPPPPPLRANPTVALFGDSQGMALVLNKPADLGQYLTVVDNTIPGCGILLGKVASRTGEKRNLTSNCRNWQPEWAAKATRTKPDLAVVMVGAWDVFDLTLDTGATVAFRSPAWDEYFGQQISRGVDILLGGGAAQVALALLPCYRPIKGSAGFWPERGDDDRTRHVNDLIRAVAASHGGIRVLEPPTQFCTDPAIGANTAYRWDGVHYYKKGAALYFSTLVPQLLPPPPTPGVGGG
jgi:peptidoglycan/LPS O-acetylase OafA/YrhL